MAKIWTSLSVATVMLSITTIAHALPAENNHPFFITLGTGASFSNNADIKVDNTIWDPAPEGYNSKLGKSWFYTLAAGYKFTPLISGSIETNFRPSFKYSKYQSNVPGATTPYYYGAKTRKFALDSTAVLANITLHGEGLNLFTKLNSNTTLQPFAGAGAGVAYNKVSDFYSVLQDNSQTITSTMEPKTKTSFAWQVNAGLEFKYKERTGLSLGYRYFDGGKFESNNYLTSINLAVPAWQGNLTAHEVFLNLNYYI